jgi:hypothetical protein
MVLANGASAPVRPTAENVSSSFQNELETSADFDRALDAALAGLDRMMGPRARTAAIANARCEILAAVDVLLKAEKRRIVAELTPARLRMEVRELLDAHESVLNYVDDLTRSPVIAAEVQRMRRTGQIPWPL